VKVTGGRTEKAEPNVTRIDPRCGCDRRLSDPGALRGVLLRAGPAEPV